MAVHSFLMKLNLFMVLIMITICLSCTSTQGIQAPRSEPDMDSMMKRLKLVVQDHDSSVNCWASLMELQACTGEVIEFFYDGETYLGPACCRAIRIIERHCWPAMLGALGFTSEEGDILRGYCDSEDDHQLKN